MQQQQNVHPGLLLVYDIFSFSSTIIEHILTKLDRKQGLNFSYQVFYF